VQNAFVLLSSTGFALNMTNRAHFAYYFLLTHYSGKSINECNLFLQEIGIAETDLLIENSK